MLPKVFVLLILMVNPEGEVGSHLAGTFNSGDECTTHARAQMEAFKEAEVPSDKAMLMCVETPWVVKGARGA